MTQRLIAFLLFFLFASSFLLPNALAQETSEQAINTRFNEGLACLAKNDAGCAQVALANIPSTSVYAKILEGNIAAASGDYNRTFILLLPLQANKVLTSAASASLHASLALAYDQQSDGLRALDQRSKAITYLTDQTAISAIQQQTWQALSVLSRDTLIDMRGDSPDTITQGWIDLALAAKNTPLERTRLEGWMNAYPDHPATEIIAQPLLDSMPAPVVIEQVVPAAVDAPVTQQTAATEQHVALILPYLVDSFYPASDAIEHGFMAAQAATKDQLTVKIYATNASAEEIGTIYQQAVQEGAKFIIGPLGRDEVSALAKNTIITTPTLTLNKPEPAESQPNLYQYGLSFDNEARQIVSVARAYGMQSATIVMVDEALESRMAKTFADAWTADGGQIRQQISINASTDLGTIKTDIQNAPADMIFFAVNAEDARRLRPYLDQGTPTFGISRIFGGILNNPDDARLAGIRFIDMPWLLQPHDDNNPYSAESASLPAGEMQRWFALGVDAYRIQTILTEKPGKVSSFMGLSGKIRISADGEISRELAIASFGKDGITLEKLP